METETWYKEKEYKIDHYNCIFLRDNISHNVSIPSYHAVVRDGKIIQVMSGFTRVDSFEDCCPLNNPKIEATLDSWITFIEAKEALSGEKDVVVSIEDNKLKRVGRLSPIENKGGLKCIKEGHL